MLFTCNGASTEESVFTPLNSNYEIKQDVILPVPYYDQGNTNWCLYYCLSMILNYNNQNVEAWEIAKYFNSGYYDTFEQQYNPFDTSLKEYVKKTSSLEIKKRVWGYNLGHFDVDTFNDLIVTNLEKGQPVLMAFQYEVTEGEKKGHAIVAVGFDKEHIYISDPSGAISRDLFGIKENTIAVPVKWSVFNEKLTSNIAPSNMAYTIEIIEKEPEISPEGSIFLTDCSDNNLSGLIFTSRNNFYDVGILRFDGMSDNGYSIVRKGNISNEREISSRDCMSVYFTISNPTSTQKEYTVRSYVISTETEKIIENFFFETDVCVRPYSTASKGINYENQLESLTSGSYRIILTLLDTEHNIADSIAFDLNVS